MAIAALESISQPWVYPINMFVYLFLHASHTIWVGKDCHHPYYNPLFKIFYYLLCLYCYCCCNTKHEINASFLFACFFKEKNDRLPFLLQRVKSSLPLMWYINIYHDLHSLLSICLFFFHHGLGYTLLFLLFATSHE